MAFTISNTSATQSRITQSGTDTSWSGIDTFYSTFTGEILTEFVAQKTI